MEGVWGKGRQKVKHPDPDSGKYASRTLEGALCARGADERREEWKVKGGLGEGMKKIKGVNKLNNINLC